MYRLFFLNILLYAHSTFADPADDRLKAALLVVFKSGAALKANDMNPSVVEGVKGRLLAIRSGATLIQALSPSTLLPNVPSLLADNIETSVAAAREVHPHGPLTLWSIPGTFIPSLQRALGDPPCGKEFDME